MNDTKSTTVTYDGLAEQLKGLLLGGRGMTDAKADKFVAELKNIYETRPWRLDDIAELVEKHKIDMDADAFNAVLNTALAMYNVCPNKHEFNMLEYMMKTQKKHEKRMKRFN